MKFNSNMFETSAILRGKIAEKSLLVYTCDFHREFARNKNCIEKCDKNCTKNRMSKQDLLHPIFATTMQQNVAAVGSCKLRRTILNILRSGCIRLSQLQLATQFCLKMSQSERDFCSREISSWRPEKEL